MTKTLILPAEVMSRELDARLLQGVMALDRGWRVITGSKALLNRIIWRLPPSVYLCQTVTHKRRKLLDLIARLGHISYGWDEEGLIYLNRETYLSRRVSSQTLELLQEFITWGEQSSADVEERAGAAGLVPKPWGNPRFDLLRPELRDLYRKEVDELHRQYGDYILVNTNYGMVNPIISIDPNKPKKAAKQDRGSADLPVKYSEFVEYRRTIFEAFKDMLAPMARQFPDMTIVVRPHPGEEFSTWAELGQGIENLEIVREGPSIPWQIGAKALVHNNCTTAAESACIGHTPIAYCPVFSEENECGLPNLISHRVDTLDALMVAIKAAVEGQLEMSADQRAVLDHHVANVSGPMCTRQVLDLCEELYQKQQATKQSGMSKQLAKSIGAARNLHKSMRINHQTDIYIPKVFPEIEPPVIAARASLIAETLNLPFAVNATQLSKNVFELHKVAPS